MGKLRPAWPRVKFGQVVRLNKDSAKDPEAEGLDKYVGLEHLEPGDLRVRNWGDVADGTTFTNRFRPGQVLFGKRRSYQRKMAIAEFDGVCSGDIYVFETKDPSKLMPELLPYICQTDSFFEHAIGTSAGSLSPRTNWTSLSAYEFSLPPLEEQQRIVRAVASAREVVEAHVQAQRSAEQLFHSIHENILSRGLTGESPRKARFAMYPSSWPLRALGDIAQVERGKFSHRPRNLPEFFGGKYPFIQVSEISASLGTLGPTETFLSEEGVQYSRSFPPGTVLISITGVILAWTAIANREVWAPDSIVGVHPGPDMSPQFLEFVLRRLRPVLNGPLATLSTTQKNINLATLRPLLVPCPPREVQDEVASVLGAAQEAPVLHERRAGRAMEIATRLVEVSMKGGN